MSKKTMGKQTAHKNNRTAKKKAVLGTEKKSPAIKILALSGVALVIGAFLVFNHFKDREGNAIASAPSAVVTKDAVTYPVSLFADGKARHFSHKTDGLTIRYFVLKSADGVIRAAFDACDVCWPANKGYYQEGDVMVCRNCGRKFASIRVNEVKGGCNPAPLNRAIQGDQLVIAIKDILEGKAYFDFSRKG